MWWIAYVSGFTIDHEDRFRLYRHSLGVLLVLLDQVSVLGWGSRWGIISLQLS